MAKAKSDTADTNTENAATAASTTKKPEASKAKRAGASKSKEAATAKSQKTKKVKSTEAEAANGGTIQIQYYRSFIAAPKTQKQMVRSLGFTKLNQVVVRPDNASMRGAVAKVPHLLRIVE